MKLKYKSFFLQIILSIITLEILSAFTLKVGLVNDYYTQNGLIEPKHLSNQGVTWRTEKEPWGAWHKPNSKSRHVKKCFDVWYESNNYGARDQNNYNDNYPANSIVTLGDSFIEGYGLNFEETLIYKLQKKTNRNFYNLGSSFSLGPLQYYLIYKNIGVKLPHDTVIVAFLPENDFSDNDLNEIKRFGEKRFRPYYNIEQYEEKYPISYPKNAEKRERIGPSYLKRFFNSQSLRSYTIRLYKNFIVSKFYKESPVEDKTFNYKKPNLLQQKAAIHFLERIYNLGKKNGIKSFIVFSIPTKEDFQAISKNKYLRSELPYWEKRLKNISKNNSDFKYIDGFNILQRINSKEYSKLFHNCDGHWSDSGTSKYSELILEYL